MFILKIKRDVTNENVDQYVKTLRFSSGRKKNMKAQFLLLCSKMAYNIIIKEICTCKRTFFFFCFFLFCFFCFQKFTASTAEYQTDSFVLCVF